MTSKESKQELNFSYQVTKKPTTSKLLFLQIIRLWILSNRVVINAFFVVVYLRFLQDELFLLVTDQGFLTEDRVIWESLTNVEGDGFFVDAEFRSLPVVSSAPQPTPAPLSHQLSQEDQE